MWNQYSCILGKYGCILGNIVVFGANMLVFWANTVVFCANTVVFGVNCEQCVFCAHYAYYSYCAYSTYSANSAHSAYCAYCACCVYFGNRMDRQRISPMYRDPIGSNNIVLQILNPQFCNLPKTQSHNSLFLQILPIPQSSNPLGTYWRIVQTRPVESEESKERLVMAVTHILVHQIT